MNQEKEKQNKLLYVIMLTITATALLFSLDRAIRYNDLEKEIETVKGFNSAQAIALQELEDNMYRECEAKKQVLTKEVTVDACYKTIDLVCHDNAKDVQKCLEMLNYVCKLWEEE